VQCLVRRGSDWDGAPLGLPVPPAFGQGTELFESDPVFRRFRASLGATNALLGHANVGSR